MLSTIYVKVFFSGSSKLYQATLKETEPRVVERSEIFMPEEFKPRSNDIDSTWGMIDFMSDDLDVDDVLKIPVNRAKPMQFRTFYLFILRAGWTFGLLT